MTIQRVRTKAGTNGAATARFTRIENGYKNHERLSGDLDAAERDHQEALRIARRVDYREGVASYTGNLAELALERGDWPGAENLARESLRNLSDTSRILADSET
jgi:hypothetical protein